MSIRVAIPEPTSLDLAYNARCLPSYIAAMQSSAATVVIIPLHERPDRIARLLAGVQGVLLPGSPYDIDPAIYGEERISACNDSDPARAAADELLLQDAFNLRKPLLGICGGMQSMNVWRGGSLIQDLVHHGRTVIDHAPERTVEQAHQVDLELGSRLAAISGPTAAPVFVNSSHHQAVKVLGDNLRATATCPADQTVEAIELSSADPVRARRPVAPGTHPCRQRLLPRYLFCFRARLRVLGSGAAAHIRPRMSSDALPAAQRLDTLLSEAGQPPLSSSQALQFQLYLDLLQRWNSRMNLTAVRDQEGILSRHFVESIACARALPSGTATLLDLGSGAGFPGIPIAICRPEIAVTLAESQGKKAAFLQEAVRLLSLSAKVHAGRAESLTLPFDCITLRAVDRMAQAVTIAARLVRSGGHLALFTTRSESGALRSFSDQQGTFSWSAPIPLPGSSARELLLGRRIE